MRVKDLINILQQQNQDAEVCLELPEIVPPDPLTLDQISIASFNGHSLVRFKVRLSVSTIKYLAKIQ